MSARRQQIGSLQRKFGRPMTVDEVSRSPSSGWQQNKWNVEVVIETNFVTSQSSTSRPPTVMFKKRTRPAAVRSRPASEDVTPTDSPAAASSPERDDTPES